MKFHNFYIFIWADDFLEGDSGVFDFLGGSPASIDVDQDDASNNSHDSVSVIIYVFYIFYFII